jgi:hypothetical protein
MARNVLVVAGIGTLLLGAASAAAAEYHVDGTAPGPGDGTAGDPWTSIQQGIDALAPGDTLIVHAGTYDVTAAIQVQGKHGTEALPIVIRAEGAVVLDGADRDRGVWQGLVNVQSSEWITIQGFTIEDAGFFGILFQNVAHGTAEGVSTNRTNGSGLASWTSSDITFRNNDVQSCCNAGQMGSGTGCQECISLDHVDGFTIERNLVHDSQQNGLANWGGGEGIDVKNGSSNGVVRFNEVRNIVQLGIYVDAWEADITNVEIYGNRVHHNANGIIITSEQTGNYGNIRIHDNLSYDNAFEGISISHYDVSNPTVTDIQIYNNTVVHNGFPGSKPYFLPVDQQNASWGHGVTIGDPDVQGLVIRDNIFYDNATAQIDLVAGLAGPILEHNLVGPTLGSGAAGDGAIQTAIPGFVDYAGRDLRLAEGSPAIDAGIGGPNLGATDCWGNARVAGSVVDVGAFEFASTPPGAGGAAGTDGGLSTGGAVATGGVAGSAAAASDDSGGCGCHAAGSAVSQPWLLLVLGAWFASRRRTT